MRYLGFAAKLLVENEALFLSDGLMRYVAAGLLVENETLFFSDILMIYPYFTKMLVENKALSLTGVLMIYPYFTNVTRKRNCKTHKLQNQNMTCQR